MPFDNIPPPLADALAARDYAEPTAVQAAATAPEHAGRDLIVSAQTGSGKTVAYGLAFWPQVLQPEGQAAPPADPVALVIAPTRELALQVSTELTWLYGRTGARITTCVGGMDPARERRALGHGVHIVVGTPGRLRDHLERGALSLQQLRVVVLDEADEMLDMGFREDLEEILDATPAERRTLLFSATMPRPIVALAKRYQKDAAQVSTLGEARGHGDIAYQAMTVAPADIEHAVVNLLRLHHGESAILFCATRENVRRLHAALVERGFGAVALSGEHSQNERNHALQALRDGRAQALVATDVAARGIDVPNLTLVVHVEPPRDPETLQHRSGRTGRAGRKGTAVLVVPYTRRRQVEFVLRGARINAQWIKPPTPEDVQRADRERLLATLLQPIEPEGDDAELVQRLLAEKSPQDLALALVRAHRARLPAAEELVDSGAGSAEPPPSRPAGPPPNFKDTVWFRMNVGRHDNADPRWLLPLLCRRGHVTKHEIGAIRIGPAETVFEIPRDVAGRFVQAVKRTATEADGDGGVLIEPFKGPPPRAPQRPRPAGKRAGPPRGRG